MTDSKNTQGGKDGFMTGLGFAGGISIGVIIIIIVIFVLCCFCCLIMMLAAPPTITTNNSNDTTEAVPTTEAKPSSTPTAKAEENSSDYVKIFTFKGSSDRTGETFDITGEKFKVVWTLDKKNDYPVFSASAVVEGGDEFWDAKNITTLTNDSGETIIYETGTFYLKITSANVNWTVDVYDFR